MPINTIEHWVAEFDKWLHDNTGTNQKSINVYLLDSGKKTSTSRLKVTKEWSEKGGVLLLGYELFRTINVQKVSQNTKRGNAQKEVLITIREALLNSDLVVCDEGHRIKNMETETSIALREIRTSRKKHDE